MGAHAADGAVVACVLARHLVGTDTPERRRFVPRTPSNGAPTGSGIAVIPMHGVLAPRMNMMSDMSGGATFEDATAQLRDAVADTTIGTIVLDWDSPGGSCAGATEFAAEVLTARKVKPVIAHANFEMCSAAYWIGACASEVIAAPSAFIGSIGVYTIHEDLSEFLAQLGVKLTYISAGKFKVDGNEAEPLSDHARERMQANVNGPMRASWPTSRPGAASTRRRFAPATARATPCRPMKRSPSGWSTGSRPSTTRWRGCKAARSDHRCAPPPAARWVATAPRHAAGTQGPPARIARGRCAPRPRCWRSTCNAVFFGR